MPNKTARDRVGADARQKQPHDEVEEVEAEEVSENDEDICDVNVAFVLVDEGHSHSNKKRKQTDLTDGGGEDAE